MKMGPEVPNCYYRVSVKALIVNDNHQVLAVNERGNGWDLPGGGLEWNETAQQALARELREEIGCSSDIETHPVLISPAHAHAHNQHVLWIVYRAQIKPTEFSETETARFMTLDEIRSKEEHLEANWESPIDFWGELERLLKA